MKSLSEGELLRLKAVGTVHTTASDDQIRNRVPGLESTIEIFPAYEDALDGLEGFSHVFVVGYFHKLRPEQVGPMKVKPRGLLKDGFRLDELPLLGVFSLDSPTRPNPIGLSLVPLLRVEGKRNLVVSNLDYFDGTPVLDVKPYQTSYRVEKYTLPDWHMEFLRKAGHV